ncbi:MAG TPA: adenosylcobinamide-GDP ribazoletransferase [Pyrinomonadaceae bacterium]|nr:adenosylcobinamide-GDP ribazoletransferase [Pyrinomonadaceae bacterium]
MPNFIRYPLVAIQFLTRLPMPGDLATAEEDLGRASAFFPLVGIIIGGSAAGVFVLAQHVLPLSASVFLAIVFASFLTNGLHEDGLADTFDGFGGGWTKDRVLQIMRDSRIGTYGTLALIFLVLGKYNFLSSLPPRQIWRWLMVAHAASRWTTLPLCASLPYARAEGQGKLVAKQIGWSAILIASITLLATFALLPWKAAAVALFVTVLVTVLSGAYYHARLKGITGDCLGATNQLNEITLYLTAVVLVRFSLIS